MKHYNHIANQNKAANVIQLRQWIESHPPDVIRKANNARKLLRSRGVRGWHVLHDDRKVKGVRTAYLHFVMDRRASGDFAGIPLLEGTKRIAQEWKELSADEKQVSHTILDNNPSTEESLNNLQGYVRRQEQDMARYTQEIKAVYDRDVQPKKKATS